MTTVNLWLCFCKRAGFWSAMASNLTNQSRNVLSKKVMVKKEVIPTFSVISLLGLVWFCFVMEYTQLHLPVCLFMHWYWNLDYFVLIGEWFVVCQESIDNITLFSIITIMSFILLAPVSLFMEGVNFTPAYLQSAVSYLYRAESSPKFGLLKKYVFKISCWLICISIIVMTGVEY